MSESDDSFSPQSILYLLSVLQRRVQRALDAEIKGAIDGRLSISHGDILFYLFLHGRARIGEITHHLGVTKSTMTVLIRKLEALELVHRHTDPADARTTLLELSSNAHGVIERARGLGSRTRRRLLSRLGDGETRTLVRLLSKLKLATEDW